MQRQIPEIVAARQQDIDGAELHLLAKMQCIEVGDATTPRITASPSRTKRACRILRAASTIQG
jgi:hypothetical protein